MQYCKVTSFKLSLTVSPSFSTRTVTAQNAGGIYTTFGFVQDTWYAQMQYDRAWVGRARPHAALVSSTRAALLDRSSFNSCLSSFHDIVRAGRRSASTLTFTNKPALLSGLSFTISGNDAGTIPAAGYVAWTRRLVPWVDGWAGAPRPRYPGMHANRARRRPLHCTIK